MADWEKVPLGNHNAYYRYTNNKSKIWILIVVIFLIGVLIKYSQDNPNIQQSISGKTTDIGIGYYSIKDITNNPTKYEGKTVELTGQLYRIVDIFTDHNGDITFNMFDSQGYYLHVISCGNRYFTDGDTYTIKGPFMKDTAQIYGEVYFIRDDC